ncbi:hypothetical protein [Rhodalgimonas zhirmunskyi]|uniref:Nickel/cobalt transporter regulator n=1 Tax=Rhodalgimonas zhirmunskyi TaxID=2964767 RepID=A0AAJ1X6I1_9RHOB|nr:hypothetical protein [Rhodoalgimonas zhirmunskyi]MDQ2095239.1 hypothetical protein [Rhodoalgimonas zhirmunskyi]
MKRTITLATVLLMGLSPMAMAAGRNNQDDTQIYRQDSQQQTRGEARQSDRQSNKQSDRQSDRQSSQKSDRKSEPSRATQSARSSNRTTVVNKNVVVNKTVVAQKHRALPGRAASHAEMRRLPRLPNGQSYRVVNDRVVRVDSNTAEIIAAFGLLSILLNQH